MKYYKSPLTKYWISLLAIIAIVETQVGQTYYVAIALVAIVLMLLNEWYIDKKDGEDNDED